MKRLPTILFLFLAATFCVAGCNRDKDGPTPPSGPNVVDYTVAAPGEVTELLTEEKFNEFIAQNELAIVKFGAEWCPPCKKLDPEFDKIAGFFQDSDVKFARVDCDVLADVANRLKVNSIPDTRVFYEGKEYSSIKGNDPYGIAAMVKSMRQETSVPDETVKDPLFDSQEADGDSVEFDENLPPEPAVEEDDGFTIDAEPGEVTRIVSVDDLDKFLEENDLAVIKFGATWCPPCRALEPKLPLFAGYFKDKGLAFADVDVDDSEEIARRYEISAIPDVIVFHKGERKNHVLGYLPDEIMSMLENFVASANDEAGADAGSEPAENEVDEPADAPEDSEPEIELDLGESQE